MANPPPEARRGRPRRRRAFVVSIEPRILLSADLPGAGLDGALFPDGDTAAIVESISERQAGSSGRGSRRYSARLLV